MIVDKIFLRKCYPTCQILPNKREFPLALTCVWMNWHFVETNLVIKGENLELLAICWTPWNSVNDLVLLAYILTYKTWHWEFVWSVKV